METTHTPLTHLTPPGAMGARNRLDSRTITSTTKQRDHPRTSCNPTFVSQMVVRLHNSISLVMRYGKSSGVLEIDPAVRRSSGQSLKKAAPGAPFGWTSEGTPYIGTQYCIQASPQGFKFASLSTRNGNSNYYWKPLNGLSATVALSALETYGAVDHLCAGESRLPLRDIMSPVQIAKVRAVFVGLLGADVVASFESVADTPDAPRWRPPSPRA